MGRHFPFLLKTNLLLFTLITLSPGCSQTQMFYIFAERMLLNRIDNYFNLNSEQEKFLEQKIEALIIWHKTQELQNVRKFLSGFNERFQDGWTHQDMDWIFRESKILWTRFMYRSIPDFARFLTTVDPDQIEYLKPKLADRNQFLVDLVGMNDVELLKNPQERLIELVESWLGPLTPEQNRLIRNRTQNHRTWFESRIRERNRFNQILLNWLENKWSTNDIEKALRLWVIDPEMVWTLEFKKKVETRRIYWINLALFIDSLISPEQREHVLSKTQDFIDAIERFQVTS